MCTFLARQYSADGKPHGLHGQEGHGQTSRRDGGADGLNWYHLYTRPGLMGYYSGSMGFYSDLMGFYSDSMGY